MISLASTNYFKVKDSDSFLKDFGALSGVEIRSGKKTLGEEIGTYSLVFHKGYIYYFIENADKEKYQFDLKALFEKHLAENWVALIKEAGIDVDAGYVTGRSIGFSWKGDVVNLHLSEILNLAKQNFGNHIKY